MIQPKQAKREVAPSFIRLAKILEGPVRISQRSSADVRQHYLVGICVVLQTAFRPLDLVRKTKIDRFGFFIPEPARSLRHAQHFGF